MTDAFTSDPSENWRQLTAAAVLGADRLADRLPDVGGEPGRLLKRRAAEDSATRMLQSVALLGLYELAGRRVSDAKSASVALPNVHDQPACNVRAGGLLAQVLQGEYEFLLKDWCTLASGAGVRVPDELLPLFLERVSAHPAKLDRVLAEQVIGHRGRWLAAMNPAWRPAGTTQDHEAVWKQGLQSERLAALESLRRIDPARALELVIQTWTEEQPDDRAAIVAQLRTGLSMEDEEFLESALEDKRKPVRLAAADLLAELPESRYAQRMAQRVRSLIEVHSRRRLLRGAGFTLEIQLPKSVDSAMARDGIENKRLQDMGQQAHALCQILDRAPLDAVLSEAQLAPADLVALAKASEWKEALLRGWCGAAIRQRSGVWAQPILTAYVSDPDIFKGIDIERLAACLDPATRESMALDQLRRKPDNLSQHPVIAILKGCDHAWSKELSVALLAAIKRYFGTQQAMYDHAFRKLVTQTFSRHMSVDICGDVPAGWNREDSAWHKGDEEMVAALAATLEFRRAMQEEFAHGR